MTPEAFIDSLASLRFRDVFNPYADRCADHDAADAPGIRKKNLRLVLEAALSQGVNSIWVARDLGYRGGRRTGLALTDEAHLDSHSELYGKLELSRATHGPVMSERTATVIWQVIGEIGSPVFLWNVFPLHPHGENDHLSNRCHSRIEREASKYLLHWLIDQLRPEKVVAIGRDAQLALSSIGLQSASVRHPSYGGKNEFIDKMRQIYQIYTRECMHKQLVLPVISQ